MRPKSLRRLPALLACLFTPIPPTLAADPVFQLGTIQVIGTRPELGEIAPEQVSSVVSRDEIQTYNRETVGDAVNLLSGVTLSRNSRNELTVYLRGYDPRQAPLFIDGIPVYVPYDGYVDFGRFDTADLAAIQVAKGFSSVVYGPNTLGGAINLISRKPSKTFEGDAGIGLGEEGARRASVNLGSNQGNWYVQAGVAYREADGFSLSDDFKPTGTEDGGRRDNAYYKDSKATLKLGLTPGGGDEYALTYTKQNGEKGQPPSTVPTARYWQWPYWDKESLYFVSRTGLGVHETLKLRLYTDKFDNEVDTYTDSTYTTLKTSGSGSVSTGRSIYHDKTIGGSVELESRRFSGHTLRLVGHYKSDRHEERDGNNLLNADFEDTLRSLSIEDGITLGDKTLLSLGLAHHELAPDKVYKSGPGPAYALPDKQTSTDPQIGLFHDLSPAARLYATVAEKTRLPTLKDRYSARLGNFIPNPDLGPEQARNYEIGYQGQPWAGATAEAALFWNDIQDKIQEVRPNPALNCSATNQCQMQNVGKARIKGVELGLKTPLGTQWEIGGNVTWMDVKNLSDPTVKLTGIPETKIILHALWRPVASVDLIAFAEHDGGRWATNTVKLDGFATLNLKAVWRPMKDLSAEAGVSNVTDKNYELDYGFPAAGRMWFANLNYRF
ncbi:MAG TPA: TonB-dependent receptor [Thiobacillaceae bacterium]|nr:TonB-dependent receptor [Thiobacillaceae bacterium]HNU65439.1 TonB-dependent receptor [Thiobacillaceae bacterium]